MIPEQTTKPLSRSSPTTGQFSSLHFPQTQLLTLPAQSHCCKSQTPLNLQISPTTKNFLIVYQKIYHQLEWKTQI